MIDLKGWLHHVDIVRRYGISMSAVLATWREASMTGAELRVLEARMDNLNTMLQDLVHQLRRIQTSGKADHGQQGVTDLSRWLALACPPTWPYRSLCPSAAQSPEVAWCGHLDNKDTVPAAQGFSRPRPGPVLTAP